MGAGGVHGAGRERGGGAERCEVTTPQGTAGRHREAPTQSHRTQLTRSLVTSAPVQHRGNRRSHACSVSSPGRTSSRLSARAAQPHTKKASFLGEMGFYGPADPPGKFGGAQGQLSHRRCLTAALPLSPPHHGTGDADPQHGDGQWPWGRQSPACSTHSGIDRLHRTGTLQSGFSNGLRARTADTNPAPPCSLSSLFSAETSPQLTQTGFWVQVARMSPRDGTAAAEEP